jgi:hypothetical protein
VRIFKNAAVYVLELTEEQWAILLRNGQFIEVNIEDEEIS